MYDPIEAALQADTLLALSAANEALTRYFGTKFDGPNNPYKIIDAFIDPSMFDSETPDAVYIVEWPVRDTNYSLIPATGLFKVRNGEAVKIPDEFGESLRLMFAASTLLAEKFVKLVAG